MFLFLPHILLLILAYKNVIGFYVAKMQRCETQLICFHAA